MERVYEELVDHFDTHDWGDYLEQMPEAEFEVDIGQRVHLVALDADLADRLTEIARTRRTSSEALVNTWVRESSGRRSASTGIEPRVSRGIELVADLWEWLGFTAQAGVLEQGYEDASF